MKKVFLILLAATLPLAAGAQKTPFGQLREKYAGQDGYTVIEITQAMLDLLGKGGKNTQVSKMIGAINGIKQITIIMANDAGVEFTDDIKKFVGQGSGYKLLTAIAENKQNVLFHYKDNPGSGANDVSELIMIMHGSADNLIMRIQGNFSIKQISSVIGNGLSDRAADTGF